MATFYPKGELIICKDIMKSNSIFRLSYKFDIFSVEPFSHKNYYIDALTGDVLNVKDLIFDNNTDATGMSLYSGTVQITTDLYHDTYYLDEIRSSYKVEIETYNNANSSTSLQYIPFTNSTTTWPSSSAIDVHWGTERIFDYWLSRNWISIDGSGHSPIYGFVHFGNNWDNAGWDGYEMLYGDGGSIFKPLVSLDIIAHETGHGIMQYTSGFGKTGENGALNEGFSDIWGAVIEHWAAPNDVNKQTWLSGEQIMKKGRLCNRSLRSPKTEGYRPGYPVGCYPDTYKGLYWDNSSDPEIHINSTVFSHWFYLLSQGGSGTNDLNNSYTVYGMGINNAADIVWKAESSLLTHFPSAEYNEVMTQTIQAATDLSKGTNTLEVMQIKNAWYAVGFGTKPLQISISGSSAICTSGTTFTLNNVPSGCSILWTCSPQINKLNISGNTVTFTSNGSDIGWIEAQITDSIGGSVKVRKDNIIVGLHLITSQTPLAYFDGSSYNSVCNSQNYSTNIVLSPNANYVDWSRLDSNPQIVSWYQSGFNLNFNFNYLNQTAVFRVSSSNSCGSTNHDFGFKSIDCSGGGGGGCNVVYSLSPNPSKDKVKVIPQIPAPCDLTLVTTNKSGFISVFDQQGSLKKKVKYSYNTESEIDVSNFKDGIYFVEIYDGVSTDRQTIVVQH